MGSEITLASFTGASAHIGGVFVDCDHKRGSECKSKNLLSEEFTVPEPTTIALLGVGLVGVGFAARMKSEIEARFHIRDF